MKICHPISGPALADYGFDLESAKKQLALNPAQ